MKQLSFCQNSQQKNQKQALKVITDYNRVNFVQFQQQCATAIDVRLVMSQACANEQNNYDRFEFVSKKLSSTPKICREWRCQEQKFPSTKCNESTEHFTDRKKNTPMPMRNCIRFMLNENQFISKIECHLIDSAEKLNEITRRN